MSGNVSSVAGVAGGEKTADHRQSDRDSERLPNAVSGSLAERVVEWVDLLKLCERRSVSIHVVTHNRIYDPADGRDRRSLLEDAVDGEYESSPSALRD